MKASELTYPVLCLAADGTVFSVSNATRLTICSKTALRNGFYSDLVLVDSSGQSLRVRRVEKQPLTLWQRLAPGSVKIELELESTGPIALDELKARVLAAMSSFPEPWDSAVGKDMPQWEGEVRGQPSIQDLIRLLVLE